MGTVSKVAKVAEPVTGPKANLRERTYTFTAELYHAGQLKVSGCRTLKAGQLLEGLAHPDDGPAGDSAAMSPLRAACELGRSDLVELLLDAGADVHRRAHGVRARG